VVQVTSRPLVNRVDADAGVEPALQPNPCDRCLRLRIACPRAMQGRAPCVYAEGMTAGVSATVSSSFIAMRAKVSADVLRGRDRIGVAVRASG